MGSDARCFFTGMYCLLITICIAVGVGVGSTWLLWCRLAEEPRVDLILICIIMSADSWARALAGISLNLVTVFIGVHRGITPAGLAEEPLVDFPLVAVVVGSDAWSVFAVPFLDLIAIFVQGGLGGLCSLYSALTKESLVDGILVFVIVGANTRLSFAGPLLSSVSVLIKFSGGIGSGWWGGWWSVLLRIFLGTAPAGCSVVVGLNSRHVWY